MKISHRDLMRSMMAAMAVRRRFLFASLFFLSLLAFIGCRASNDTGRQTMVHERGTHIMPFDLEATQHIFQMTDYGGIQLVVAKKGSDTNQINLIRQHLQHEAVQFEKGDFSDPASMHGATMPGIAELSKNIGKITIEYSEVPEGAQITFKADDIHLITEIHRWFGAQLSDHGSDATYQ